jgi:hypothetical protein
LQRWLQLISHPYCRGNESTTGCEGLASRSRPAQQAVGCRGNWSRSLSCLWGCGSIPVSLVREPSLSSYVVLQRVIETSFVSACQRRTSPSEPSWRPLAWTFFTHGNSSHEAAASTGISKRCHRAARSICISASRSSMRKAANADFDPSRPSWKETETGTSGAAPLFSALGEITSHRPFLLPATTRKPNQIASIHLHVQMQRTTCKLQRGPSSACTLIRCTTAIAAGKHNSTMGLSSAASRPFESPTSRSFAFSFNDSTSLFALRSTLHFPRNPICHPILP